MCGKFTQMASWQEVVAFSQPLVRIAPADQTVIATPMRFAQIMHLDNAGARVMSPMRWGFADRAASNPSRPKHMHVRAETIDTRATFADSFAHRRGVLITQTFNEGEELPGGKTKQWTIKPKDGQPIAMAVIFEDWRNGEERLLTFVQVTAPANALISRITDRMPAILTRDQWGAWLGETDGSLADKKALLQTYEDGGAWRMEPQESGKPPKPAQPDLF